MHARLCLPEENSLDCLLSAPCRIFSDPCVNRPGKLRTMSQESNKQPGLFQKRLLSSKELFSHRKPGDKSLPKKGAKDSYPDGSWLQQRRLETYWEERRDLLSEQRVEKLKNVVKGYWNPDKDLVELEKELGKFWANMGFVDEHRKWLLPEEALFLMETSALEVWYGSVPVSIQQAYSSFLGRDIQFEEYQVYAHLRRLGYVVIRHTGPCEVTRYERQIRLDQHIAKRKRKRDKKNRGPADDCRSSEDSSSRMSGDVVETESVRTEVEPVKRAKISTTIIGSQSSADAAPLSASEDSSMETEADHSVSDRAVSATVDNLTDTDRVVNESSQNIPKYNMVDFSDINIPSVFGQQSVLLEAPSSELLPQNVIYPGNSYAINLSNIPINAARERKSKLSDLNSQTDGDLEFSFHHVMNNSAYKTIRAKNWKEYKAKKRLLDSQLHSMENSPVAHLWEDPGEVTPLVRPQDGVSTASLLQKLSVIQECEMKSDISSVPSASPLRVVYDVYQPDSKFRKSSPGIPQFRIYVQKHSDEPPNLYQITEVTQRLDDDVSLLCAVVDSGEIALYTFNPVSLPVDVCMG